VRAKSDLSGLSRSEKYRTIEGKIFANADGRDSVSRRPEEETRLTGKVTHNLRDMNDLPESVANVERDFNIHGLTRMQHPWSAANGPATRLSVDNVDDLRSMFGRVYQAITVLQFPPRSSDDCTEIMLALRLAD
jgi:hypothetical protein